MDLLLQRAHQLKVVAIRVSQGGDPSAVHLIWSPDYYPAQRFDPFKFLFDLRRLKIQHNPAWVFRFTTHLGMLKHAHVATSHLPTKETILTVDHIRWFSNHLFIEGCEDLGLFRPDHDGIQIQHSAHSFPSVNQ